MHPLNRNLITILDEIDAMDRDEQAFKKSESKTWLVILTIFMLVSSVGGGYLLSAGYTTNGILALVFCLACAALTYGWCRITR